MANKKMALIATKGTLDMAYPPFILRSSQNKSDLHCCKPLEIWLLDLGSNQGPTD